MPSRKDEDILSTARTRLTLAQTAEYDIRSEARCDLEFAAGQQWNNQDRQLREAGVEQRRPCLTFNKLNGPLNQVANEARMNKPSIEVHPVDSLADPDTAKVIQGMIRHIEYVSKADEVYDTGLEQSAAGSFGYFRVDTRYCGPDSFDQELVIERIVDPFAIYIDPFAKEADKSDMRWAFELELIPRDDYKQEYGDTAVAQANFFVGGTNPVPSWVSNEGVLIARYWEVTNEKKKLVAIEREDGSITAVLEEDLKKLQGIWIRALGPDGKPIERETEIRKITRYKINGHEILDQTDWPGQWIPILPVLGKEMYIEGDRYLFSVVRFARDAQRLYNYYRSSEAETVALGTKAPWIGVKGAFRDPRWRTANVVPWAYLEYEPLDIAGQPAPPPTRNAIEPPIQAYSAGAAQASDDIKATTNIFDASLGQRSNETSGIAIRQRQGQAGLSNFHFVDNLNRAIRQCGVILCDLIPKIYDTAREVRILGEDSKQQIVKVNQNFYDDQTGGPRCYDLASGKYDVTISIGTSKTQRQEAFETLTQFAQAYPQLIQIAGDIIFSNADFPGGDKLAERLKKALPPELRDQPEGQQRIPPAIAAQVAQMNQAIEQLTAALNKQNEEIRTQKIKAESDMQIEILKLESSDRQAALKAQVDLFKATEQMTSVENVALLKAELAAAQEQIRRMESGAAVEEDAAQLAPPPPAMPAGAAPQV